MLLYIYFKFLNSVFVIEKSEYFEFDIVGFAFFKSILRNFVSEII